MLALGVGLLVILGLGAVFMLKKTSAPVPLSVQNIPPSPQPVVEQKQTGLGSLADLLKSGVSQECDYSYATTSAKVSGKVYLSSGKMRSNYTTTISEQPPITGSMIVDGQTMYLWSTGQTQGFKATFDETKANEQAKKYVDVKQKVDYSCRPGIVDASLFIPPTDVKFTDFSEMMKQMTPPPGAKSPQNNCSACNYLSGEQKTSCLQSLNCP